MAATDPGPGIPTPTGTLQGIAQFRWDGAAWVPGGSGAVASTPAAPLASAIAQADTAVTVFAANSIVNCADILNTSATEVLYVDLVTTALAGSATSIPLQPGQAYRVSGPIKTAVSVVAHTQGHAFVAVRY